MRRKVASFEIFTPFWMTFYLKKNNIPHHKNINVNKLFVIGGEG